LIYYWGQQRWLDGKITVSRQSRRGYHALNRGSLRIGSSCDRIRGSRSQLSLPAGNHGC
jgi:hypothetical protein